MKKLFTLFLVFSCISVLAQEKIDFSAYKAPEKFDNIHVQKINSDSLQTTFIIWIKQNVKAHYHENHTENIIVLEGKAEMVINGDTMQIAKGDYLNIPKKTVHEVTKVHGKKPLKVISIQSPIFDGTDRVFVDPKNEEKKY